MRAFYAIAHRCTAPDDVDDALADGANGIECDVRYYDNDFWIRHDHLATTGETRLGPYLGGVKALADEYGQQFALILFDMKPEGMSGSRVAELLERVRMELTDDTGLNVLFSISRWSNVSAFGQIRGMLRTREGLAIDEEDSPTAVAEYFAEQNVQACCYGNGIDWLVPDVPIVGDPVDAIDRTLQQAVNIKLRRGAFRLVYTWTIDAQASMEYYVEIGLDGILTNDMPDLMAVLRRSPYRDQLRLATRADDAFTVNARPYVPRYLGNKKSKELHDLDNEQDFCQIDEIKHPRPFTRPATALHLGYEGCGWCNLRYHTR